MLEETPQQLGQDVAAFRDKLQMFLAETQLSYGSAAKLFDVSSAAMGKWFTKTKTGKIREPATYIRRSVELKLDRLNAANKEVGIYSQLRGLDVNARVEFLSGYLFSRG